MAEVCIPRWLIMKVAYPEGHRLDKRTLLKYVPKHEYKPSFNGDYSWIHKCTWESLREKIVLQDTTFGFSKMDYRFWCVEVGGNHPITAICRRCNCTLYSPEKRKKHHEMEGCAGILVKAYVLLLRDKLCAICDNKTENSKWGVPLCNNTMCLDAWMHETPQPDCIQNALLLIAGRG